MSTAPYPVALPSLFLSHGSPLLALEDSVTGRWMDGLAVHLPRPRAVLVASAHALAAAPRLSAGAAPATLHDFGGFPAALYALRYPAPGAPALAQQVAERLRAAGLEAVPDRAMPFDHGVWVPLRRMFATADIPVLALSISPQRDAHWHYALGQTLAPLRSEGVLVIGSGGFVHNLGALDWHNRDAEPAAWAHAFAQWLAERVCSGQADAAQDWLARAPYARQSHPTPEHLLPLFVAWGAAGAAGAPIHEAWEYGTLALHAFRFEGNA